MNQCDLGEGGQQVSLWPSSSVHSELGVGGQVGHWWEVKAHVVDLCCHSLTSLKLKAKKRNKT